MEPLEVEFRDMRTGETVYAAEPVGEGYDGPTMTLSWDEKGVFRLENLD